MRSDANVVEDFCNDDARLLEQAAQIPTTRRDCRLEGLDHVILSVEPPLHDSKTWLR